MNKTPIEPISDKPSITTVSERLNIKQMLERAARGILDLDAYSCPMSTDDANDDDLDRDWSVIEGATFGADRDKVTEELTANLGVVQGELFKQGNPVATDTEQSDTKEA